MGLRQSLKNALRTSVFVLTPALGIVFLPLRLLDLVVGANPLSRWVARTVNAHYPLWFHLAPPTQSADLTGEAYVVRRREVARGNLARYGVALGARPETSAAPVGGVRSRDVDGTPRPGWPADTPPRLDDAPAARRFLEVGCGTGAKTDFYGEVLSCPSVGVDVDLESLRYGMDHGERTSLLLLTPPYRLPFADDSFDVVLCEEVLEHVDDPRRLLEEIARVLTPGGRALLLVGPLYLHAKGPHLQTHLRVLWPHVLFSHTTVEELLRSTPQIEGLLSHDKTWEVFRTLNGHGRRVYTDAFRDCGLDVDSCETVAEFPALAELPGVGAFYRKSLRAVLRKT